MDVNTVSALAVGVAAAVGIIYGLFRFVMKLGVWLNAINESSRSIADNTQATAKLTQQMSSMTGRMDQVARLMERLEARVERLERQDRRAG